MATYKLEISKKFGKFTYKMHAANESGTAVEGLTTLDEVIRAVESKYDELDIGPDSDVIFRGIAYNTFQKLRETIRSAPY